MTAYNIDSYADLKTVQNDLAGDYTLTADIDASLSKTENWNDTAGKYLGFLPIGLAGFTGTFDGGDYTISNLYIYRNTTDGVGLFGKLSTNSEVKDLSLVNCDVLGLDGVGSLVGDFAAGTITNCHASGTVESIGDATGEGGLGGLIGHIRGSSTVTDSTSSCSVVQTTDPNNNQYIGGFIGNSANGTVTDCTASGSVTATFPAAGDTIMVAGFVGFIGGGDYDGCYSTGTVNATVTGVTTADFVAVGGFVGRTDSTTIDKCFSYSDVNFLSATAVPIHIGGFVGRIETGDTTQCGAEGNVENYSTHATVNYSGGFVGSTDVACQDCYALGTVNLSSGVGHTDAAVGGFVGLTDGAGSVIDNCFSAGEVYAGVTNGGGFQGKDTLGSQTNCFFDKETSGYTTTAGDATDKTTTLMKTASTFTDAGWDLTNVWEIDSYTRAPGNGATIWFSGVGDYEDFAAGTNDNNSFSVELPTQNKVVWIEALEVLMAGTGGDEWKVGSNNLDTPVTPTNFTIRQQTDFGGKQLQPIKINEAILFVDFVGRKLREMTFSEDKQKYVAPDLTSLSEHITSSGVIDMAVQKNPDSIVWCVLDDGSLISMTYERDQNVIAWAKHPIGGTSVEVQSVAVIPASTEDEVWITVSRTINSASAIYVEKMASRTFTDINDAFFVDSGITDTNSPASATITGLTHLVGESVVVLGDGVEYTPTAVVNGSGEVTISTAVSTAQVGLSNTYKLQPMRLDVSGPGGTTHGSIKKFPELVVSFLNTQAARYGDSASDLYEIDFSDERWVDNGKITGLFTGDVVVAFDGGFNVDDPILISDNGAMPCTIRAIVARIEKTGR